MTICYWNIPYLYLPWLTKYLRHQINDVIPVNKSSYLPYAREINDLFHQASVLVNSAKWNLLAIFAYKIIISERRYEDLFTLEIVVFPSGDFFRVNKSSYLPYAREIDVYYFIFVIILFCRQLMNYVWSYMYVQCIYYQYQV
jgi:hypothetical protein